MASIKEESENMKIEEVKHEDTETQTDKLMQLKEESQEPKEIEVITACAIPHNICLGVGDIMAPEDDAEDEGEHGLETVSGAPWRDQLSALEEVPIDHDYL
ncbi:unnamed protein product [Leuciscus chuanchicus]